MIDESSAYPKQQIDAINKKLKDAPKEAFLATIVEIDESEMVEFSMEPEDQSAMKFDWTPPAETAVVDSVVEEVALVEKPEPIVEEVLPEPEPESVVEEVVEAVIPEPEPVEEVVPEPEPEPIVEEVVPEPDPVVEEIAEAPVEEEKIVFRNILFDFDRSFLREESKVELNKISDYMSRKQSVNLRIDGHADWIGTPEQHDPF